MGKKRYTTQQHVGEQVNPLIIACLEELEKDARNRKNDNLKKTYTKALRSVQKYPLKLNSGEQARKTLDGVGPVLAKKIDQYLEKHGALIHTNEETDENETNSDSDKEQKATKKKRKYSPQFKSAAWAMLVTLYRHLKNNSDPKMTKTDLIKSCSSLTDTPMTVSGGKFQYSGWNSMNTLLEKELVKCGGRPKKYELSSNGRKLSRTLHVVAKQMLTDEDEQYDLDFDVTTDEEEEEESSDSEKKQVKKKKTNKKSSKKEEKNSHKEETSQDEQIDNEDDIIVDLLDEDDNNQFEIENNNQFESDDEPSQSKKKSSKINDKSSNLSKMSNKKDEPKKNTTPLKEQSIDKSKFIATYVNASHQNVPSKDESQVQVSIESGM